MVACSSIIGVRDLSPAASDLATEGADASADGGAPSGDDGGPVGAGDDAAPTNDNTNNNLDAGNDADASRQLSDLAREKGASVTATSTFSGFPASRLVDGDVKTSWYADSASCAPSNAPAGFSCTNVSATVILAAPRTVARLAVAGNHDGFTNYDVVTGRWELFDAANDLLSTTNVTLVGPTYDGTTTLPAAVSNVAAVRFVVLTAHSDGPGLGEIEVYAE